MAGFEDMDDKQRADALARSEAMRLLLENPETSEQAKRLLMKANPKLNFQDVRQADAVKAELTTRDTKINELEAKLMEEQQVRRREEMHRKARERGLDPEKVEKTVVDYSVMDWEKAMDITERLGQLAPASQPEPYEARVQMPDSKELWSDPRAYANKIAHQVIEEARTKRRVQ